MAKLSRDFYVGTDTIKIGRELLGKLLVVPDETGSRVSGMIVEVEAYMGVTDKAAHSYGGRSITDCAGRATADLAVGARLG